MNTEQTFSAPWSKLLIGVTLFASGILVGVPAWLLWRSGPETAAWLATTCCALILLGCVLFTIRGYVIRDKMIFVRRLLWSTRMPLDDLQSAEVDPAATGRSLRLFGNGGLFAFCGWFRNRKLGLYRMFVTDPARAVVLKFSRRTVVLSPEQPELFASAVRRAAGLP